MSRDAPGYLLSEATIRKLQEVVRRLEGELRIVRQQLASNQRPAEWPRELMWGVTSKRDDASYPDSSAVAPGGYNVYWVELADVSFTLAAAATLKDGLDSDVAVQSQASNFVQACSLTNVPIPEGTRVVVERQWSTEGWRYWIRPNWPTIYIGKAAEDIAVDDNGQVDIYNAAGSTIVMSVTAYYTVMTAGLSTIATGAEVVIMWYELWDRWIIIGQECGF